VPEPKRPTIKVPVNVERYRKTTASCAGLQAIASTQKDALAKLTEMIVKKLHHVERRHVVGTKNGEVLIGFTHPEGNEYVIVGPGRESAAWCTLTRDVVEAIREHAKSCYGGIAWEMSI
jgi:hypothetical protein